MKIPLKVTGPMHQPHPSCAKIETSALTGGMVLSNKLMQVQTGDILNYFEVRAGAHSAFSCIGLMTQASYEEGDVREFDARCVMPRLAPAPCVMAPYASSTLRISQLDTPPRASRICLPPTRCNMPCAASASSPLSVT
jgi:hypothetical protein